MNVVFTVMHCKSGNAWKDRLVSDLERLDSVQERLDSEQVKLDSKQYSRCCKCNRKAGLRAGEADQ
jgi:hypothetical protein